MMRARPVVFILLSLLLAAGLSACGQKGPLYLPEDAPATADSMEK
ncbi:lipoprotein [Thalassolituus sp. ST750PaO-4]|jgi:predicted small lipoprotein YifL|nr:lipoprotein [Thalassolituus sp. ST750PaO-4]TVV44850.1 lipoprotein [Thalassolituus sp. C2-1]|tara:strand:- start:604 stop:738 length:135 start_codon:yes stop_codon:yes gene_type:complete